MFARCSADYAMSYPVRYLPLARLPKCRLVRRQYPIEGARNHIGPLA